MLTTEEPVTPAQPAPTGPERRSWRGSRLSRAATAGVLVVLVTAGALWLTRDDGPAPVTRAEVGQAVESGIAKAREDARKAPTDATAAYRTISPSLVTVTAAGVDAGLPAHPTVGSGVVVRDDGTVLTALHVVTVGGALRVTFADGTVAAARIVSKRPASDIAVLAVDRLPGVVVPAVMGGAARVGDAVYPVGNPLALQGSLSAGVVSAVDRTIRVEDGKTLAGLIQFDAAVNPGSSGGPLLDRDGHVIGIVTGLANPAQQPYFVGIGFAVPIATAGGAAGSPAK